MAIELHVMAEMAKGRSVRQIAGALRIGDRTLRTHLRKRGYRVDQQTKLVRIDSSDQGEGGRRARGTTPKHCQDVSAPDTGRLAGGLASGRPRASRGR